ncbi:sensor histidine kinase [Streptomyces sp. NPDC059209]|uniref:sensor histidine kinase n=1 Tax=Streptomyces sp. NPDC059209 TaxID=3346769 RepID=UPI0036941AE6
MPAQAPHGLKPVLQNPEPDAADATSWSGGTEALFLASARRLAGPVRGVTVVVISAFGLLAVPERALPLGFALFGLMLAGAAVDCWTGLTGRAPALSLGCALLRVVAVCGSQDALGAATSLWALNVLTTTAITLQWEWPPAVAVPCVVGLLAHDLAVTGSEDVDTLLPRLVFECFLARLGFILLRRSGRRVDRLRRRSSALARAEALAVARHRQEREYLALLHDTAASTFLMVAVRGQDANPDEVAGYARRDLAILTGTAGEHPARDSPVDLPASLRTVLGSSRINVHVRAEEAGGPVPASVALAFVRALHEVLANVERHARTDSATLSVRRDGKRVVVVVCDDGVGFDPAGVPPTRRGIRGSITERMAAVGGCATVRSQPGAGTCVRLEWPGD